MNKRPETVEELVEELFNQIKSQNELQIIYLEARLHREADWVIPGARY